MAPSNFKVIVVGGGPVGLTAAHALHAAGIDFLMLERRPEIVIDAGSNLVLSPVGLRTFAQLGLHQSIDAVSTPLGRIDRLSHSGRNLGDVHFFEEMKKTFGVAPRVISRHSLTEVLYNSLPVEAQRCCLGGKKLSNISTTESGVVVTCADGSSYSASTVIGADGAHSTVREQMRKLATETGSTSINAEQPYLTTFQCLWIRFPKTVGMTVGTTCETHGHNAATQLFVGEETGVLGLYERLDEPQTGRIRFSQQDQDALIERLGHIPVLPGSLMTLKQLYESKQESGMVSLEEGVVDHWSLNSRIVLTGDAAHKFTPSTGAGCNNGMIDIVVLVNKLREAINSSSEPTESNIEAGLLSYQQDRHAAVVGECERSGRATQMATWQNKILEAMDRWVFSSRTVQRFLINSGAPAVARTPRFDAAVTTEEINSTMPWVQASQTVAVSA